jgi:hypothetical protein
MSTTNFSNDPGTATGGTQGGSGVKDQAQQAAGTAADEGKKVAGVAKDEVKNVTAEAQNQLRGLIDQATSQVDEQSKAQKSRLAETVRTFGDDLESMRPQGEGGGGVAAQVVQQVAQQARSLASHLDDKEPTELLDDVRAYARRRPGTFLLGALAAGVVAGRLTRGAKEAQSSGPSGSMRTDVQTTTPGTNGSEAPVTVGVTPEVEQADVAYTDTAVGPGGVHLSEAGLQGPSGGRA